MDFKGICLTNYVKVYSNQESCGAKASIPIPALRTKSETKDHMMRKLNRMHTATYSYCILLIICDVKLSRILQIASQPRNDSSVHCHGE